MNTTWLRRVPRPAGYLLLIVAVATVAWLWLAGNGDSSTDQRGGRRNAPVAVETVPVAHITMRDIRRFNGTLQPRAAFDLAPKIGGRLKFLQLNIGDVVENGQVVARLDDDELQQQMQQAQAELGVAQAALQEARSLLKVRENQLERQRQLHTKGIGSQSALETAQADVISQKARVEVARAQVTQREAALAAARVRLSYAEIRAEWNGGSPRRVIGERYVSEGDMLAANRPLVSVLDISELTAVVFASEADYSLLRVGQPVTLMADALPGRHFQGHIARIAPQFQADSRQARMEVSIPNAEQMLKPGMYARVDVQLAEAGDVTAVPQESVVVRKGGQGVFVAEGDPPQARFVPVRTGLEQNGLVQIVEPALQGDVVQLGQHLLQDGSPLRLPGKRGGGGKSGAGQGGDGKGENREGGNKDGRGKPGGADGSAKRGKPGQEKPQ